LIVPETKQNLIQIEYLLLLFERNDRDDIFSMLVNIPASLFPYFSEIIEMTLLLY